MCLAIRRTCSSDSITFGPASKKNGFAACQEIAEKINLNETDYFDTCNTQTYLLLKKTYFFQSNPSYDNSETKIQQLLHIIANSYLFLLKKILIVITHIFSNKIKSHTLSDNTDKYTQQHLQIRSQKIFSQEKKRIDFRAWKFEARRNFFLKKCMEEKKWTLS